MSEETLDTSSDLILINSDKITGSLLTNTNETQHLNTFTDFATPVNSMVIGTDSRYTYVNQYNNPYDREYWWVNMDHCYARPWNWRPETTFLRPTKTLFIPKPAKGKRKSINPLAPVQNVDEEIDVESTADEPTPIFDKVKAKHLMEECDRHASLARIDEGDVNWEDTVTRYGWTLTENRIFDGMVNILNSHYLARLAHVDTFNEPIARRTVIDKSVQRVRRLMATIAWDPKYTQWLHQLLVENLSTPILGCYLDILQTLRSKLPTFVDKLMTSSHSNRLSVLSYENLFPLLKRPWDPVAMNLVHDKPKKLPGTPVIIVIPSTPTPSKRMHKWIAILSNLATVVTIPCSAGPSGHKMTLTNYVDQMFVMTRSKITDLRADYPGRNIVLLGFNFGATLALQIAQIEQILCVICLGFSLLTAEGKRGDPEDNLLELQCPVLFVTGQCSNTSLQEDMEDLRERMRVETGLIVVGSADDNLRISKKKKKTEGITQSVVDRCIVDEIGEFISGMILSPYPPQIRQSPTNLTTDPIAVKKVKTERKRYNSNTSSLDSEPPSPTPRISRPVGRPPGSKGKAKLEAKWAAQGIPPSPSDSSSPVPILSTPDTSSNDSFLTADKTHPITEPSVKKLKTLKPTVLEKQATVHNPTLKKPPVKALNLQNRTLSNLLLSDISTLVQPKKVQQPKASTSGIKVLENLKLNNATNQKIALGQGRNFDLGKLTGFNASKAGSGSSIVLLPDGKFKNVNANTKAPPQRKPTNSRQLLGNKPPKPVKKLSYVQQTGSLAPPANLTTQDIMDLPIIFADDNQILDSRSQTEVKSVPTVSSAQTQKLLAANPGKLVLINKPISLTNATSSYVIQSGNMIKKSTLPSACKGGPKFTKIILSTKKTPIVEEIKSNILNLSPEVTVKKVAPLPEPIPEVVEILDLENEIAASTVYKKTEAPMIIETQEEAQDLSISGQIQNLPEIHLEQIKKPVTESGEPPCKVRKVD